MNRDTMIRVTAEEYRHMGTSQKGLKRSKHRNIKQYLYEDGFVSSSKEEIGHGDIKQKYDSIKEFNRHIELQLLEKAGQVLDLECQKTLLIAEAFKDRMGKKHRAITYKADFFYNENGHQIVEDVKGFDKRKQKFLTTEAFNLKWKLLQAKYKDYVFRLY